MANENGTYVTTRELQAELRGMRWEMRALILLAALANLGVGYAADIPGITQAVGFSVTIAQAASPWF